MMTIAEKKKKQIAMSFPTLPRPTRRRDVVSAITLISTTNLLLLLRNKCCCSIHANNNINDTNHHKSNPKSGHRESLSFRPTFHQKTGGGNCHHGHKHQHHRRRCPVRNVGGAASPHSTQLLLPVVEEALRARDPVRNQPQLLKLQPQTQTQTQPQTQTQSG